MAATARYSWPISVGRAHVQAGLTHQSSAEADIRHNIGDDEDPINPNDFLGRIRASTLVDLFAGFDWQRYNFELFATNIFDQRNELSRLVVCSICTATKIVPGRPRTIGFRVGAKF
jgi:iron complex outermembrane recepter protein